MTEKPDGRSPGSEPSIRTYPNISPRSGKKGITLDITRNVLMFKTNDGEPANLDETHVRVSDVQEAFTEEKRRLSSTVFQTGLILVLLIGAYLAVGEHLELGENIEQASYIFFLGLSAIGFFLVIIYFILKEKVLILRTGKDSLEIVGELKELSRLRFDIHSLAKGRLLGKGDEDEGGALPTEGRIVHTAKESTGSRGEGGGRKVLTCPQCGSGRLYYEAGLMTGYKYHCKGCDYIGTFVIEKEIKLT